MTGQTLLKVDSRRASRLLPIVYEARAKIRTNALDQIQQVYILVSRDRATAAE